jgi:FkbH-like protein
VDNTEDLASELKATLAAGRLAEAAALLRDALLPDLDYSATQTLLRIYRLLQSQEAEEESRARVAVLGGYDTSALAPLIELYLFGAGVPSTVFEAGYGVFRQAILDQDSSLYSFRPETVFIATGWRDVSHWPGIGDPQQAGECCQRELEEWLRLWQTLHERAGCTIIQNNFDVPPWRILANHESRHPAGLSHFLMRLSLAIADQAPSYVIIHDVDHLAALRGRLAWSDPRFYYYAKMPCASQYLADYAHSVASLIAAQKGRSRKCLVLDLDNTLWGGIVGEDGIAGIRLGQGDPEAEAFVDFQRYVKALGGRGVLLAVCSKNEDSTAREVFDRHPAMVLKLSDFACFMANWNDKAANLRVIATQLNIGLDSLVFVDDSPAEGDLIRRLLPEVAVPEMPDDPAKYVETLEKFRYFQVVSLAEEDLKRTQYYRADESRAAVASAAGSLEEFLTSLDMRARVAPVEEATIERCAQLINRSNQFNLTTRRTTAGEVRSRMKCQEWVTLTVSLSDRFGDNGLISVLMARVENGELLIDTWVMSCRVVKRTVESFLMNELRAVAEGLKMTSIRGEYIPTPKNILVRDHYQDMGFSKASVDAKGRAIWVIPTNGRSTPLKTFVQKEKRE